MDNKKIIEMLRNNPKVYKYIDFSFKSSDFVLEILREKIDITEYLEEFLLRNRDIFKASFKLDTKNVLYFKQRNFDEKMEALKDYPQIWNELNLDESDISQGLEIFKKILIKNPYGYMFAPSEVLADERVAQSCLKKYPESFQKLNEFQNNEDFALRAIEKDKRNYHYVSENLKNDLEFIKKAIDKNGYVYEELEFEIKLRKEIALKAMEKRWGNYYSLPIEFKKDYEFLDIFFRDSDYKVVDIEIDKEVEKELLQKYPQNIKVNDGKNIENSTNDTSTKDWYSSLSFEEQLKKNNIMKALELNIPASTLNYFEIEDKESFETILKLDPSCVFSNSFEISKFGDENLCLSAIKAGGNPVFIIDDTKNISDDILLAILENDYTQFVCTHGYLFQDKEELILIALEKNPELIKLNLVPITQKFLEKAVEKNPQILLESYTIQPSKKLLEAALSLKENSLFIEILNSRDYLQFLDASLIKKVFLHIGSLRRNGKIIEDEIYSFLKYIPENLKRDQEVIFAYIQSGGSDFSYFNQIITEIMLKLMTSQALGNNALRTKYLLYNNEELPFELKFEELMDILSNVVLNEDLYFSAINKNLLIIRQLIDQGQLYEEKTTFLICFYLNDKEFEKEVKISKNEVSIDKEGLLELIKDKEENSNVEIKKSCFLKYLRFFILKQKMDEDSLSIVDKRLEFTMEKLANNLNSIPKNLDNFIQRIFGVEKKNSLIEVNRDTIIIEGRRFKISNLIKSETDKRAPKDNTLMFFSEILKKLFNNSIISISKSTLTMENMHLIYNDEIDLKEYREFYNFFRRDYLKRLEALCKEFNAISNFYSLKIYGKGKDLILQAEKK